MRRRFIPMPLKKAFTLVELLVAMSVLIGLTLLVTSLISSVTKTTTSGKAMLETDAVARSFFNRLTADLNAIIIRNDVNYWFDKIANNQDDIIAFPAHLTGDSVPVGTIVPRPLSRIYYRRVNNELSRAAVNIADYSAISDSTLPPRTALMFASTSSVTTNNETNFGALTGTSSYQGFGPEIIRFEISPLVQENGGLVCRADIPPINQLKGIIVTIAVADSAAFSLMSIGEINDLADSLTDSSITEVTAERWKNQLAERDDKVSQNIRVYERVFLFPR